MGNDLIPHQQPFSYRRPPLPSTTSSVINDPPPIDDSHQRPYPSSTAPLLSTTLSPFNEPHPSSTTPLLSTTPSPFNDLIHHQQPLFYRQTPLPSTISSFINHPLSHQPLLASTTSSIYQSLPHQHDNPYEEHTPPGFSHSTSCGKSYIRFSF